MGVQSPSTLATHYNRQENTKGILVDRSIR